MQVRSAKPTELQRNRTGPPPLTDRNAGASAQNAGTTAVKNPVIMPAAILRVVRIIPLMGAGLSREFDSTGACAVACNVHRNDPQS